MIDFGLEAFADIVNVDATQLVDDFDVLCDIMEEAQEAIDGCTNVINALVASENLTSIQSVVSEYGMSPALEALIGNNFATTDISLEAEEVKQNLWKRILNAIKNIWGHIVSFFKNLVNPINHYISALTKRRAQLKQFGLKIDDKPLNVTIIGNEEYESDALSRVERILALDHLEENDFGKVDAMLKELSGGHNSQMFNALINGSNANHKSNHDDRMNNSTDTNERGSNAELSTEQVESTDKAIELINDTLGILERLVGSSSKVQAHYNKLLKWINKHVAHDEKIDVEGLTKFERVLKAALIATKRISMAEIRNAKTFLKTFVPKVNQVEPDKETKQDDSDKEAKQAEPDKETSANEDSKEEK